MRPRYPDHHLLVVNFTTFYCLGVIEAARARGIRVTVAGPASQFAKYPEAPAAADRHVVVDLDDETATLDRLTRSHADRPFTRLWVSFEPWVELTARLAERFGIPWNSVAATDRIRSKWLTRQALSRLGFDQPEHHLAESAADVARLLGADGDGAWVVKPERRSGSEGITRISAPDRVGPAVDRLRAVQPDGPFVVERCIEPAREYSVEGVWLGDEPHVLAVVAKRTTGAPYYVEFGHALPAAIDPCLDREVRRVALAGLRALGASHGPFHVEVFVQERGGGEPRIVFGEGHVRAGGDRITQLLRLVGYDLDGLSIDAMVASELDPPPPPTRAAAVRYFLFPPGRLAGIDGLDELRIQADVVHVGLDVEPGDRIQPIAASFGRHGRFVLVGDDPATVDTRADQLLETVRVTVEPPPAEYAESGANIAETAAGGVPATTAEVAGVSLR